MTIGGLVQLLIEVWIVVNERNIIVIMQNLQMLILYEREKN
jgi:hypothetical protein